MIGGLILPTLIAGLWLFRDKRSIDEFRAGARNLISKLGHAPGQDPRLWGWVIRPVSRSLGRIAAYFDGRIHDMMADMWEKPARAVRDLFVVIEQSIIDRRLIDGLGEAVASIGKSLRLVQSRTRQGLARPLHPAVGRRRGAAGALGLRPRRDLGCR